MSINRSASLKLRIQSNQNEANKIQNQKAFTAHIRDLNKNNNNNCCDDKVMVAYSSRNMMRWYNVLVFSVVVLINIASINCMASRHVEGEFFFQLLINWVEKIMISFDRPRRKIFIARALVASAWWCGNYYAKLMSITVLNTIV